MTELESFLASSVAAPLGAETRPQQSPARIAECIGQLTTLFALQRALLLAAGGWLASVPYWDAKLKIGEHILEDAHQAEALLKRLHELKATSAEHKQPAGLDEFVRDLACARSGDEWLQGFYRDIKPWLTGEFARYLAASDPVMDRPTREIIEATIAGLRRQNAWFETYAPKFSAWEQPDTTEWRGYLGARLSEVTIGSDVRRSGTQCAVRPEGSVDFIGDRPLRRDAGFRLVNPAGAFPAERTFEEKRLMVFFHHVQEMQFAESLGAILSGTPEMPWAFHHDLARHLADEVRHSHMGEERLAQLGISLEEVPMFAVHYQFRSRLHPLERFALMTLVIEAGAFESKRTNVQLFEANGDAVSALYESYDIRDEMLHTNLGHLWVPIMLRVYHDSRSLPQLVEHCRNL
ncbi:MAG: hypothetical protein JWM32_2541 [Verrucomicrobia bacterium]|nr:hypothetical protein [Verrucomicrobiota bacterium]